MEKEFCEIDSKNAWAQAFQQIRSESGNYNFTYKDARKAENKNLNRYRDVNPYDHSRVRLSKGDKDYINASFVEIPAARRAYILTQGPLPITTGHFWLMIWEQKSKAVLMLNRVIEKNTVKCHQYWPLGSHHGGEDEMVFKDVNLKVTICGEKEGENYTVRELLVSNLDSNESRMVLHFHYTTWPDFGVPESPSAFLNFLMAVRDSGALNQNVGPAVVHCSAGIGRSGTFCLVDSCLILIEESGSTDTVNVQKVLLDMRKYRMGLIQTPDQLRFSYLAIIEGAKQILADRKISEYVPSKGVYELLDGVFEEKQINNNESEKPKKNIIEAENCEEVATPETSVSEVNRRITETNDAKTEPPPLPPRNKPFSDIPIEKNFSEAIQMSPSSVTSENVVSFKTSEDLREADIPREDDEVVTDNTSSLRENSITDAEIRKRRRKERLEKTAETVQKMRRKLQDSESRARRRLLLKQFSIGLVLLLGTGVLVYRYYVKS